MITFPYIPSIYRHLKIFLSGQTTAAVNNSLVSITLNNDSGANYDTQSFQAHSTTVAGSGAANQTSGSVCNFPGTSAPVLDVAGTEINIFDYLNPLTNKTVGSKNAFQNASGAGNTWVEEFTVIWHKSPTAPITRIDLTIANASYAKTVASLYGYI